MDTPKPNPLPEPLPPDETPKQRFILGQHKKAHELWTDTASGKAAMEAALAEYVDGFGTALDEFTAVSCYNRMLGAKTVLKILANLHLPEQEAKRETLTNLSPPS